MEDFFVYLQKKKRGGGSSALCLNDSKRICYVEINTR